MVQEKKRGVLYVTALLVVLTTIFMLSNQEGMASNHITSKISGKLEGFLNKGFREKYLKLTREGGCITAYHSTHGLLWEKIGKWVGFDLGSKVYIGMAVTSHDSEHLCSAVFSDVKIIHQGNPFPGLRWANKDIGNVKLKGSAELKEGSYTVKGAGKDIWKGENEFQFAYVVLDGDCTITARLVSMENTHEWAKAGILIRDSLQPEGRYAGILATPGGLVSFQWRDGEEAGQVTGDNRSLFLNYSFRKVLHFTEYFILALLAYSVVAVFMGDSKRKILLAGVLCALFAAADEIHQIFIPNRGASPFDVFIDCLGILSGILLACFRNKRRKS